MGMRAIAQAGALACAAGALISGCATERDFYEQAAKTNVAMEESHNRILLLNVIRAMKREPMHFSGFAKITGPAGVLSPSFGFQIPFGNDAVHNVFQPTFKPDVATFELAIYDKQEFMRGFTQRISDTTFEYYLDQGWPPEMVLHMFVRTIEYGGANDRKVITNRPADRDRMKEFQAFARDAALSDMSVTTGQGRTETMENVEFTKGTLPNPEWLLTMREKGYIISKDPKKPGEYTVAKKQAAPKVLKFTNRPGSPEPCPAYLKANSEQEASANSQSGARRQKFIGPMTLAPAASDGIKITGAVMHLRSPEAIVYYLGELARAQLERTLTDGNAQPATAPIEITVDYRAFDAQRPCTAPLEEHRGGKCPVRYPLFRLMRARVLQDSDVRLHVVHDGVSYGIPRDDDRSMHALSLVTQIIGLQKSANELPQSTTVRIVQ